MSVNVKLKHCWKDYAVVWWTCVRPDGTGGYLPGFDNKEEAHFQTNAFHIFGWFSTGGPIIQELISDTYPVRTANGEACYVKHRTTGSKMGDGPGRSYEQKAFWRLPHSQ
jgi:hypothetical protein